MKYLYALLLCCCFATQGWTQQDSLPTSSLTLAAIYGSTANYFGQTTTEKLPYILSHAAYKLKSGVYFSASGLTLLNNASGVAAVDLSAGYGFTLFKNTEGSLTYTRSFYQKNAPLLQASNENNVNGELSFTHFLTSTLNADYAFGKESDMFVSFSNSKLISLFSLSDKDFISLEPTVGVIGGSQRYYQTYTTEKERRKKFLDPLFPGSPPPKTETTTIESTSFDVLAYTFSLPLAYSRSNYTVEASYQATLASNKMVEGADKPVSIFNLGFYYMF